MILSVEQIRFLLNELGYKTSYEFGGRYRLQEKVSGYQEGDVGKIQAYLSVILEAKMLEAKSH